MDYLSKEKGCRFYSNNNIALPLHCQPDFRKKLTIKSQEFVSFKTGIINKHRRRKKKATDTYNNNRQWGKQRVKEMNNRYQKRWMDTAREYAVISFGISLSIIGVYFFKFPNNFAFGGVTGLSPIMARVFGISPSSFTFVVNIILLVIGFIFLGDKVGIKTTYASVLLSVSLYLLERFCPMEGPFTRQPLLELIFSILLPAIGAAILFNIDASGGGTDIIAMIVKKRSTMDIGTALMLVDAVSTAAAFFVFGIETGLFSVLGILARSLMINNVIESINACKCFNIICENPEPICDYIIHSLHRSATLFNTEGSFTHNKKTVIMASMRPGQAVKLRNFIRKTEPEAFMIIFNSSEIIGKGFLHG